MEGSDDDPGTGGTGQAEESDDEPVFHDAHDLSYGMTQATHSGSSSATPVLPSGAGAVTPMFFLFFFLLSGTLASTNIGGYCPIPCNAEEFRGVDHRLLSHLAAQDVRLAVIAGTRLRYSAGAYPAPSGPRVSNPGPFAQESETIPLSYAGRGAFVGAFVVHLT